MRNVNPLTGKSEVKDSERFSYLVSDLDKCIYCGRPRQDLHEVYPGINRMNSKVFGMVVPVCRYHHELLHKDKKMRKGLQRWSQLKFEQIFNHELFVSVFHKNYL